MVQIKAVTELEQLESWVGQHETLILQGVISVIGAIIIIFLGFTVARLASAGLQRLLTKRKVDKTVIQFSATLLRYSVIAFASVAALGRVGVETSSIIAVIGAAGLAIGLALQGSLANFAAGILLVSLRPFKAGEYVDLGGVAGAVEEVHIFSTTLRMPDNKVVVIPNGKIIGGNIINYSRHQHRRVDLVVGVAYDTEVSQVKSVLSRVVSADPRILHHLGNTIRLNEMAASSLNYVVRVWTSNANYWEVYYDLLENIKTALDEHQIGIPYPQLDVHLYQAS
ncbi:Small-conductance mechanosensitive channel [Serratia quinivorans]|uniref:Small-conductance mechanosensitive channel n=1 Tax=Serratia quinivorans TaxID=137545 RepID=A0ABV3UJF7_9GAMM|nr:small-conductance mechanosensitive channel MscS [Serratia quinivorans]CAI1840243.1 Small-conductance mechanosensitive channel [Serratia quinivorans]CAI1925419.1 Small-conductance mechanosensitive channel [Serratia quinivorans]